MIRRKIMYVIMCLSAVLILGACNEKDIIKDEDDIVADSSEDTADENSGQINIPIDLYGTYDQNDLLINTLEEEYEGITLNLPQISGLKNKDVQDKINQEMLQKIERAYSEIPKLSFLSYNVMANFSNVLSINVYMAGEAENSSKQVYLNYNLNNGEELILEDLFLSDTDLLSIIHNAFRDMLIKDLMQGDYDENQLYKIVKSYSRAEEKMFSFTPTSILLYYNSFVASVEMIDVADEVAVYSRFLAEDTIFESDDIGKKNIFTCMDVPDDLFDIWEFGYQEENLWCDYVVLREHFWEESEEMHLDQYREFKSSICEDEYLQIEEYRKIAKENPENFYILLLKPSVRMDVESEWVNDTWKETYTGKAFVNKNIQFIEMSKDTYEETYKDKLLAAYRYEYLALQGGVYLDASEDDVNCKQITEEQCYDYITGELIEIE